MKQDWKNNQIILSFKTRKMSKIIGTVNGTGNPVNIRVYYQEPGDLDHPLRQHVPTDVQNPVLPSAQIAPIIAPNGMSACMVLHDSKTVAMINADQHILSPRNPRANDPDFECSVALRRVWESSDVINVVAHEMSDAKTLKVSNKSNPNVKIKLKINFDDGTSHETQNAIGAMLEIPITESIIEIFVLDESNNNFPMNQTGNTYNYVSNDGTIEVEAILQSME
ncbi:MAG: hypothetical protein SGI89_13565 [bacterium]|nr:hypothetical protein [bacterium]